VSGGVKDWRRQNDALQGAAVSSDVRQFIKETQGQMLICAVNRLGGALAIPVAELDGTGAFNLMLRLTEQNEIYLETQRKQ
jgi:hypothetical protein